MTLLNKRASEMMIRCFCINELLFNLHVLLIMWVRVVSVLNL